MTDPGARGDGGGDPGTRSFRLHEHPWLVLVAVPAFEVLAILVVGSLFGVLALPDSPAMGVLRETSFHLLFVLVFAPFVLRLPGGRQPLADYLDEIRLTRIRPLGRLLLLGGSCYLLLALCQAAGVVVYRLTLGEPLTAGFLLGVVDVSGALPPGSWGLLVALPAALEEVTFRGVLLFALLHRFPERRAVVASAAAFGLIHLINLPLGPGHAPVWVFGQVGWATLMGLFYADVVLRSDSLLPAMLVHYLGNAFVGSITTYLQATAPVETQALYGVLFTFGLVPATLLVLWARFFCSRWLPGGRDARPT